MNASEYKKYHESFMQNNLGSSPLHTFLSINFTVVCTIVCAININKSSKYQYAYEYAVIILPLVFGHTLLANHTKVLNAFFGLILTITLYKNRHKFDMNQLFIENSYKDGRLASISCIRGLTYLITVYSILAVDFKIFPRNLAKTERFGYSLMDTGVGLFVLISGLVHNEQKEKSFIGWLKSVYKLLLILTVLGFSRFYLIKSIDYHEHVTEYGVHWNFFFTLAVSKIISLVLLSIVHLKLSLILCICVGITHEFLLILCLQQWVFSNIPRDNFISSNREGIASSLGYVYLYLSAVYIKKMINRKLIAKYRIILNLVFMNACLWFLVLIINNFRPASRTLANVGYCIFVKAVFLTVFILLYSFETVFDKKCEPKVFNVPSIICSVNKNGLLFFLMGNVITGLVNLTFRTLFVNDYFAVLILNVYMIFTTQFAIFLEQRNI